MLLLLAGPLMMILQADQRLFYLINHLPHNQVLDSLAVALYYLTLWGLIFLVLFLADLFSLNKERKLLAKIGFIAMLVTVVVEGLIIKNIVRRARPFEVLIQVIKIGPDPFGYSFPSGHTAMAFAAATVYLLTLPRKIEGYFVLLLAVLTGFDRIYMGHHFPLDVLFGAFVGVFCSWIVFKYYQKF